MSGCRNATYSELVDDPAEKYDEEVDGDEDDHLVKGSETKVGDDTLWRNELEDIQLYKL